MYNKCTYAHACLGLHAQMYVAMQHAGAMRCTRQPLPLLQHEDGLILWVLLLLAMDVHVIVDDPRAEDLGSNCINVWA